MHPAIIIGTVRSLWTFLWGRYHVPQNVFLVMYKHSAEIRRQNTDRLTCEWTIPKLKFRSLIVFMCTCAQRYSIVHCKKTMLLRICLLGYLPGMLVLCLNFKVKANPRPVSCQCHCFIITRINADEFDPDLFLLCKLNELFPEKCFLCDSILGSSRTCFFCHNNSPLIMWPHRAHMSVSALETL